MELAQKLAGVAQRKRIPGAVVAASVDGETIEAAFGVVNQDTGVATTCDSLFQIGSVTKLWTATLAHQLVDEGKLDLDVPVRVYLPDLRLADELTAATLTSRDLLRHTTGFAGDIFDDHGQGSDALGRLVDSLAYAEAIAPPGELFNYCNGGYCLLGHLIATLRDMSWQQAMRDYLVNPLALGHIALSAEEAMFFRTAVGHTFHPMATEPMVQRPCSYLTQSHQPAQLCAHLGEQCSSSPRCS